MSEHVIIDAGTLEFSDEDLTASGLLIPYGVPARSNLGTFTFAAGDITLPEDLTGMSLNVEHKREDVVGGFSRVWEQPEAGTFAAFKFANTEAGRAAYADAKSGKRKNLSAEVAKVRIRDGKALPGAVLFAGALVERPAFEGATLLAAEDTERAPEVGEPVELDTTPSPDESGRLAVLSTSLPADIYVSTPEGEEATYTPEAAPAEVNPEESESIVTASATAGAEAPITTVVTVPSTLLAASGGNVEAITKAYELGTIFASMAAVKNGADASSADAETLLAALSDITTSGAGSLPAAGVVQPEWVGKVWQGRTYQRKYIDLAMHGYGIKLGGRKGFKLDQGTALVKAWAGNKAEIPSGTATTEVIGSTLRKYGFAADIAREFYDLEGGAEVIEAFVQGVVDSYAKITDEDALADILDLGAAGGINAAGTYPAEYSDSLGMLIDGIEAVQDGDDTPSFAIVNPAAWRELIFTPKDLLPEFVSFNFATGGEGTADGNVKIVKAPASAFTLAGFNATAPAVVAGAKPAIEFREQGSTPIKLDALDIARGGIDKAVIGYLETFVVRGESVVAFGTEAV